MRLSTSVTPFILVYGVEPELPSARLTATAQFAPLHTDYVIERITALERLNEYRHDTSKHL